MIIHDPTAPTAPTAPIPCEEGSTIRWMSPELIDPERFNLKAGRRTKQSDCYALGMVIYEVVSGREPFSQYHDYAVVLKVLGGEHPERLQGVEGELFTDDIWRVLERCWKSDPGDRPSIGCILQCLKEASRFWTPISPLSVDDSQVTDSPVWTFSDISTEDSEDGEALPSN